MRAPISHNRREGKGLQREAGSERWLRALERTSTLGFLLYVMATHVRPTCFPD